MRRRRRGVWTRAVLVQLFNNNAVHVSFMVSVFNFDSIHLREIEKEGEWERKGREREGKEREGEKRAGPIKNDEQFDRRSFEIPVRPLNINTKTMKN